MTIVDIYFLVVSCGSVYKCILRSPFYVTLGIIASTAHLEVKYHNIHDELVIVWADLTKTHQIHETQLKDPTTTVVQ